MSGYDGVDHFEDYRQMVWFTSALSVIFLIGGLIIYPTYWIHSCCLFLSIIVFAYLARYIDPDLDQQGATSCKNRMIRELPFIGLLFYGWWMIYAYIVFVIVKLSGKAHPWYGAHRSELTHSIIPGTFTRVIWFDIPITLVMYQYQNFVSDNSIYLLLVVVGQIVSFGINDYIHIKRDENATEYISTRRETRSRRSFAERRTRN